MYKKVTRHNPQEVANAIQIRVREVFLKEFEIFRCIEYQCFMWDFLQLEVLNSDIQKHFVTFIPLALADPFRNKMIHLLKYNIACFKFSVD